MKILAVAVAVSIAVFTPLAMGWHPTFMITELASVGPISIYPYDIVLGLALLALIASSAFFFGSEPIPANQLVIWLCVLYLGYQLFVVLPAAVLLHDMSPIDVVRDLEARLAIVLVLAVYGVVLRYVRPAYLVLLLDVAAVALALWVIYVYASTGGRGSVDLGRFSVREIWGGATLLFGWLFFTSLFYWPIRWWRIATAVLALAGVLLANHRSGFVALLAALVVQMLATGRVTRRVAVTIAVIAVVAAGVFYAAPTLRESAAYTLRTMFNSSSDPNAVDRVVRSRMGLAYFVENPWGDYIWSQRYYLTNVDRNFAPHNFVVQLLVTQGIVASILLFSIMGAAAAVAWRNRRDALSVAMLSYLTFYLVFCLFNTNIDQYENIALLPVAVALILHQNRASREAGSERVVGLGELDSVPVS